MTNNDNIKKLLTEYQSLLNEIKQADHDRRQEGDFQCGHELVETYSYVDQTELNDVIKILHDNDNSDDYQIDGP